ncbi:hypothetical protein NFI96_029138 [Prochilodus magdalenae]|nr:hypothetical protein NFI96_029138 [Prochilodus magdalenae]
MSEQRVARKSEKSHKSRVQVKDGGRSQTSRRPRESKVLAERNPPVVPVGAWVETGAERQEHPAVLARLTEEVHEEVRRVKEETLRRFQDAVRQRVSRQAQLRKQQQLQRLYETAEREGRVVQQSSDAALRLTSRRSLFPSWPQGELEICSPEARSAMAEEFPSTATANQYSQQLSKVMKQVRLRLAACQTVNDGAELSELPGGIWKVSPTRDKPTSRVRRVVEDKREDEDDEAGLGEVEEIPLAGQHDRPLHSSKTVTFQNDAICQKLLREPYTTSSKSDYRSTQVLWTGEDEEELKRQRQSQFLMYRRLFMDIEREQVKDHQQHVKHLRRTARYIEALRAQMREKLEQEKVELPPRSSLCTDGGQFSGTPHTTLRHRYAQALHSVLLSCDLMEAGHRGTTWSIASMHALSPRK